MANKKTHSSPKKNIPPKKNVSPPVSKKTGASSMSPSKKMGRMDWITALLIGICGVFLYSNTLNHSFVLDDFSVIVENKITTGGIDSVKAVFKNGYRDGNYNVQDNLYRPLTKAMFAVEYQQSKGKSAPLHLMNVILYGLLCGFIFLSLRRFFPGQYYLALIATLLFTFHPIHTEVVANIKSRDELLALFFVMISLWFAKTYADSGKMKWIIPSALFYFLSLLTKESAITYIALLPITLYFLTSISNKKNAVISMVMFGCTLVYLGIHQSVIGQIGLNNIPVADNSLMESKDFMAQRMTAIEIMGRYLKLLIFPHPLSSDYSFKTIPLVKTAANLGFVLSLLIHAGALVYAILKFRKKSIISYAILFYLISFSVVSNIFILIGTNMAERLAFFPSLGFCLLVAYLITKLLKADKLSPTNLAEIFSKKITVWLILLPILVTFSVKTYTRNKDWKNVSTLFTHDLKTVPNSVHMLFYHAGMITNADSLAIKTEPERIKTLQLAEKELLKAISIYEPFLDAHFQLGKVYQKMGNYDEGIVHYKRFLQLNDKNPLVYNNCGTCYGNKGDFKQAEVYFKKAIEVSPICYPDALGNLANTYIFYSNEALIANKKDDVVKYLNMSIEQFNKAISCEKDNLVAHQGLAAVYQTLGDTINASRYKKRADELLQLKQQRLNIKK